MKTRLTHLWDSVTSSMWFVPALMTIITIGVSFATITLDGNYKERLANETGWIWAGGPEGAREILSTIAGSMITVAGVVFSITVVVLTLASSQFGPRLLRNFMRDKGNQVVLGTFISTFTYCLLVLRTIRSDGTGEEFVPHISVTIGIVLALASLAVLIYFIHHVSTSIQAPIIIARVAKELDHGIERMFPEKLGEGGKEKTEPADLCDPPSEADGQRVPSSTGGYLQGINNDGLMSFAAAKDLLMRLEFRPGQFIVKGSTLVLIWSKQPLNESLVGEINSLFILGAERTEEQDVEFSVHQLVEVGVRALSPGINDPFTAMTCVDRLGEALCRVAERELPSGYRYDDEHRLRVIARSTTFADVADAALNQMRQYGRSSASVTLRLLESLAVVAQHVRRDEDGAAVLRHAGMIERGSREALTEPHDRDTVEERYGKVLEALRENRSLIHTRLMETSLFDRARDG